MTVEAWRAALGLLPVPLRDTAESRDQYVLMNGTTGNFCLDFVGGGQTKDQRAATAWSCDVGHYVTCTGDFVVVNRWGKEAPEERYSYRSVAGQLHEFHRYLEKTTPDRSRSIVSHVLGVFRRIRAIEGDGVRSLRVLLHLLAAGASGQNRINAAELALWGLAPETIELSQVIPEATWRPLYNDLSGFGRYDVLRPDFQLILRHASGAVFQDAHLEVSRSPNLWLFPGLEAPAKVLSKASPSESGVYFTPPTLARTLAEEATSGVMMLAGAGQPTKPLSLFDPACGSGELLKECLRQLKVHGYQGNIRVIGWDKSISAVDMARFVLSWEKRSWPADRIEIEISQQDSIAAAEWPAGIDLLLMNPPFRSWNLMDHAEQATVTQFLGSSYKPNLAMVFAHRALTVLNEGASLAMITPNSLLEASSGKLVREQLSEILSPRLIARLGDQSIFSRALVDAGLYVGRRNSSQAAAPAVLWADSRPNSLNHALRGLRRWRGAEAEPLREDGFSVYTRDDIGKDGSPWVARSYDAWRSFEAVHANKRTVLARKLFDIRQGVRHGNDVFIITKEYFQGLQEQERRFFRPAVMNVSIADAMLTDQYYMFYRYTAGLPPIASEQDLMEHVPNYYQKVLLPAKDKLAARKTLARAGQNWWELLEHRAWLEQERLPKIVSKYFGGARSFAFDRTGEFVVVVGNAWLLKKGSLPISTTDEEAYFAMLTYLSSSIADELFKYVSVQVSGGQSDLSHKYAGGLPIINIAKLKPDELNPLVQTGMEIFRGAINRWEDVDEVVLSILSK
jgi:adenine-specific DNA-methyltransferase